MSCNTGLDNAILTILNNKPWFQYKSGDKYIKILNSPNGNINESNSIGVAKTIADTINKSINNGKKSVGKIAYEEFDGNRGVVKIAPTSKQLDLINSEDEKEIKQLLQDEELIKRQEEFKQLEDEANQTINKEGDVVIKNIKNRYSTNKINDNNLKEGFINQVVNPQFLGKGDTSNKQQIAKVNVANKIVTQYSDGTFDVSPDEEAINKAESNYKAEFEKRKNAIPQLIQDFKSGKRTRREDDFLTTIIRNVYHGQFSYNKELNSFVKEELEGDEENVEYGFKVNKFDKVIGETGKRKGLTKISETDVIQQLEKANNQKLKDDLGILNLWKSQEGIDRYKKEIEYAYNVNEFQSHLFPLPKGIKAPAPKGYVISKLNRNQLNSIPGSQGALIGYSYNKGKVLPTKDKNGDYIPDAYMFIDRVDNTEVHIRYTHVSKELRGQKIASLLLNKVRQDYPNLSVHRTIITNPIIVKQSANIKGATDKNGNKLPTFKNDEEIQNWLKKNDEIILPPLNNQNKEGDVVIKNDNKSLLEGIRWQEEVLPNTKIEFINGLVDGIAKGSYNETKDLIQASIQYADKGTIKHEVLHKVMSLLPEQEREDILNKGAALFNIDRDNLNKSVKYSQADQNKINFILKSIDILQSPKADEIFRKGDKNNWDIDKILQELQIPKQQQDLIKGFNTRNREQILTNLLANYSYTIEINTAKNNVNQKEGALKIITYNNIEYMNIGDRWVVDGGFDDVSNNLQKILNDKYDKDNNIIFNTQHYSNLTVPGGTNGTYKELNFETPLIVPSIQGHAQFSTKNSIGWARVADKQTYNSVDEVIELMKQNKVLTIEC